MKKLIHRIVHFLGLNKGQVESFSIGNANYVGFRCYKCQNIDGAHIVSFTKCYVK